MAIAKIILNGVVQMDVTGDTVAANNLLSGETATGADGNPVTGAYVPSGGTDTYSPKNDGKTHIYYRILTNSYKTVALQLAQTGISIDWGDGTTATGTAGTNTHTYSDSGLYEVTFNGQLSAFSNFDYKFRGFPEAIEIASNNTGANMFDNCGGLKWVYYHDNTMVGSSSSYYNSYHNNNMGLQYCRLDDKLKYIALNMFYYCQSLQSIIIPDTVLTIDASAFQYCRALETITIPENVTSIGNNAFRYCSKLIEYHIKPTIPPTLGTNALQTPTGCKIYVPRGYLSTYQSAWSAYSSYIQEEPA